MISNSSSSKILSKRIFDDRLVKRLCFGGIEGSYRAAVWRIIFQIVGLRRDLHQKEVKAKDDKYFELLTKTGDSSLKSIDNKNSIDGVKNDASSMPCLLGMEKCLGAMKPLENLGISEEIGDVLVFPTLAESLRIKGIGHRNEEEAGAKEIFKRTGNYKFKFQISKKTMHQIDIDIKRIDAKHKTHLGTDISCIYYHILSLIAYRRPSLGYVQGMADILVPFVLVFSQENIETAESSSYFCYSRLLDEIQHNIVDLQTTPIKKLESIVEIADPDFHRFLKDIGLEVHMFAFRWFNCFFIREFKFPTLYKILDTIFASDNINELLLYFAVALLMSFKPILIENDFSHNILFLQSIYEKEWEDAEIELLLSSARFYRNMICEHLSSPIS